MDLQKINIKNYRPEIDGLRAFAIISIIVNHFNKDLLPGGYLGVDIFFVISGYVITSSLSKSSNKHFLDFICGFYKRRITRLVPAFLLFVVITCILTHLFVQNAGTYYATATSGIFGMSNIFLSFISQNYWGLDSLMNPFIHTWSLGVEAQFYFLYPLIIWVTGYGQKKKRGSINLLITLIFLTIISLILFINFYTRNQSIAYFLMPFRFWEISIGSLLFLGHEKRSFINKILKFLNPSLCLILILILMYMPISYGIITTLLVVILSTFLIASLRDGTYAFKILTQDKVVYLGLISYSLYLWHWGILSISRWTIGVYWWTIPIQIILIYLISSISYEFIEKKFRSPKNSKNQLIIFQWICLSTLISIFSFSLGTIFKSQFYLGENSSKNIIKNIKENSKYFVIGDSHAVDIKTLLKNNKSYQIIEMTKNGCNFFNLNSELCKSEVSNKEELLRKAKKGDVVLFITWYPPTIVGNSINNSIFKSNQNGIISKNQYDKDINKLFRYFDEILPLLELRGVTSILKLPHPEVYDEFDILGNWLICKKEIFRPYINPKCTGSEVKVSKQKFLSRVNKFNTMLFDYSEKFENFHLWDITSVLCPENECVSVTEDKQYFRDPTHLFITSPTLSDSIVRSLNEKLINAEK